VSSNSPSLAVGRAQAPRHTNSTAIMQDVVRHVPVRRLHHDLMGISGGLSRAPPHSLFWNGYRSSHTQFYTVKEREARIERRSKPSHSAQWRGETWSRPPCRKSDLLSHFWSDLQSVDPEVVGRAVRRDRAPQSHRACASACDCGARFRKAARARAAGPEKDTLSGAQRRLESRVSKWCTRLSPLERR